MPRKSTYYISAVPIDADAQAIFDKAEDLGSPFLDKYQKRINSMVRRLKSNSVWTGLDWLTVEAMISTDVAEANRKIQVSINMRNPAQVATYHNDYVGAHTGGVGLIGNPAGSFGQLTEFNPSTASHWTQNSSVYGYLCMSDASITATWDLSCQSTNYTIMTRPDYTNGEMINNEAVSIGTYTYQVPRALNHQWRRSHRTASNLTKEIDNGMLVGLNTAASGTPTNQKTGRFGYYNGAWSGFYSPGKQGAFYAGSGSLDANKIEEIINETLLRPLANSTYMNKSILALGDSIFSAQSNGMFSRMYRTTISGLNNNWTLTNLAVSGKWASDFDINFAAQIAPYYRDYWNKEVLYFAAGTNDLANGATAAQAYASIMSACAQAKAAGWQNIVISGILDRTASLGVSQAAFDAARASLRAMMLADFTVPHGTIANYYTTNSVNYATGYVDAISNSNLSNSMNATYYIDQVHLTTVGNDYYSTTFCQPILLTF